ncbi:MAG: hypothetical protein EOO48_09520 [Flavobacterium sp.]|nr:MAG: hypothetical protein EOO48_09520 [Flavobacterium sp.]
MKRFLKHTAAFFVMAFIGYVLAICFLGEVFPTYFKNDIRYRRAGGGQLFLRMNDARQTKDVDILFLGTSHCYRGFDPRIFKGAGYSSFNMGSSIQTALQTKVLLKRNLDRLNPKLIVYEVNPVAFGSDGVESSVDLISNDIIDFETFKMALEINNLKTYNTMIFALYRQITGFGKNKTASRRYYNDSYVSGGFVEANMLYYDGKSRHIPKKYEFKPEQVKAFDEVLAMLKRKHYQYILVQTPVTKDFYASKINKAEFDAMMRARGRYYDFNRKVDLNDTLDFFDDNHLNQDGVVAFNRKLIEVMKKDKLLP